MRVDEYIEERRKEGRAFIPTKLNSFEYLADYFANAGALDQLMGLKFGSLSMRLDSTAANDSIIESLNTVYNYKWRTLYETINFEYNPIWNVDGKEVTTTEHGQKVETNNIGKSVETSDFGEKNDSNTYGAVKETLGQRKDEATNYSYPYDTEAKTATSAGDTTTGAQVNTTDARTDSRKSEQYQDKKTIDAREDKRTEEGYKDETTLIRTGNIGVKSTQSLILEQRGIAYFEFLYIVFNDLINELTNGIFEL